MNLIFDLDGTLVDSAPGIMVALEHALEKSDVAASHVLTSDLIGPPLREMLLKILGSSADLKVLELIEGEFKRFYDEKGVLLTRKFPGIDEMLGALSKKQFNLFIATNKRSRPTLILLEHLCWINFFKKIYSLDTISPPANNKTILLESIITTNELDKMKTIYIGDRLEDARAASNCGIKFLYASWGGYENDENTKIFNILNLPSDIEKHLH